MARSENLTCTPSAELNRYPCIQCTSLRELIAIIAVVSYALNHAGDHTLANMLEDGKCYACLSDSQMLQTMANDLIAIAVANGYFTDSAAALEAASCLSCTDPSIVKGIIAKALCEYLDGIWPAQD